MHTQAKEKEEAKPSGPAQPAGEEKGKDKKVCVSVCVRACSLHSSLLWVN
jgi:hypothetical protein